MVAPGAIAGVGPADGAVALPRTLGLALTRPRVTLAPNAGRVALATLILGALSVVLVATAGPTVLVPRSNAAFPNWEAGPMHRLFGQLLLLHDPKALSIGFSVVVAAMTAAYGVALASVRNLTTRAIVVAVIALHAILLLAPPLQLTDVFNYLGYARLGGLHHFNPYTHVIASELHDPVYRFTTWHHLRSPYGQLFTAASYLLAFVSLPVAYWLLKVVTVLLSLVFLGLVWRCAQQLGRDPRFVIVFVALNPIYLMYAIAGFHNDFLMLIPSTGAILLMLSGRDRWAGAALMVAITVKFTAVLLLPFLLIAAPPARRRLRILQGAAVAAVPLLALILALFGFSLPNLSDQSTLLTNFSIPNVVGDLLGLGGGTPGMLRAANIALGLTVLYHVYRRREWLAGAGWSTFALIASLAWLVPWYVIWLLPLAALATNVRLRRAAIGMTIYLVLAFVPAVGMFLSAHGINTMSGAAGQASMSRQHKLAQ